MRIYCAVLSALLFAASLHAQDANAFISNGNKLYRENSFDKSVAEYSKAIAEAPKNPVASYNLGNAHFRSNHLEEAVNAYDASLENNYKKPEREKAFYNKGVAYSKAKKLAESIDAWKNALKLDATDKEARENLQKALLEQKKQQQQKDNEKKDDKEKKKEDQKKEQDKQQQQPRDQQSKLTKKQVEQLLKALAQKEKEVQQKMQQKNASPAGQDKDW